MQLELRGSPGSFWPGRAVDVDGRGFHIAVVSESAPQPPATPTKMVVVEVVVPPGAKPGMRFHATVQKMAASVWWCRRRRG